MQVGQLGHEGFGDIDVFLLLLFRARELTDLNGGIYGHPGNCGVAPKSRTNPGDL